MLLMDVLENKDTTISLPVSSSMRIGVLRYGLCADTAASWGRGPPFQALHLEASSSVTTEVGKARVIDVSPLSEGGWIWLCAPY